MNEFQSGLLNELVAVKITTKEEFEKVINFLSINNCFLVNGEPVVKLTYPGDKAFVILKQDNAIFWQPANQVLDERYKVLALSNSLDQLKKKRLLKQKLKLLKNTLTSMKNIFRWKFKKDQQMRQLFLTLTRWSN